MPQELGQANEVDMGGGGCLVCTGARYFWASILDFTPNFWATVLDFSPKCTLRDKPQSTPANCHPSDQINPEAHNSAICTKCSCCCWRAPQRVAA